MAQSSLCGKLQGEIETNAPAGKIHEAYCKPYHIAKGCPEKIKSVDLQKGQWGTVGSITTWNYLIEGKPELCKAVTEAIDYDSKSITFKEIEGDIMKYYKSFKYNLQAVPKGEGSMVRLGLEYEKLNDDVPDPNSMLDLVISTCKDEKQKKKKKKMAQSSLCGKLQGEIETKAPAGKFHEAYCKPYLVAKGCPEKIKSVDLQKGQWGTLGSITIWNYLIEGKLEVCMAVIEAIDYDNKSLTFNVIEGDLMKYYKSFKYKLQAVPKGEGSLVRLSLEYEKLNDDVPDPNALMDFVISTCKDVCAYLT
ncbi:Bet_v_1 domain-containing protein [Cephalotus follicularis]|uniref:Bet_v_1 domain-containing protein n=1 Tax=Cephalotus follicularis TaxID=3775 RepID=A0A1Q3CVS1_CEPFO|nr:Bet_v_1 domain-containing protein [Cephalotus follicularis]